MSVPFAITAVTNLVRLNGTNRGSSAFTVSNRTTMALRASALLVPGVASEAVWLAIDGAPERDIAAGATEQYTVLIAVAPGTPTGSHSLRLDVESPGQQPTQGPSVGYEVTTVVAITKRPRGYLAPLLGAAGGA
ncbi:MAG: hypothetical protein ABI838_05340, partial [Chloroflexota bacterium]